MSGGAEATWLFHRVVQWPINHSDGGTNEQRSLNALPVCVLASACVRICVVFCFFKWSGDLCAFIFSPLGFLIINELILIR